MMRFGLHTAAAFLISLLFAACTTEIVSPEVVNPTPTLRFLSIEPAVVREFTDSIVIMLEYADQDGDLGHPDGDVRTLEIGDARLEKPDYFYVPPLAPEGQTIPISGTLKVVIPNTFLLGTAGREPTSFELRIRDRSLNWSNPVVTDPIEIIR
jgi:hypothetical protein